MKNFLLPIIVSVGVLLVGNTSAGFEHTIVDVTNGKEIRGITTPETANGYALTQYTNGEFSLNAELFELSDPVGDDFYEGWLVRRDPFDFISTGVIIKDGDIYRDTFISTIDYSAYDFYVVTLEPNDSDPAPADHIIEGEVLMQTTDENVMTIQTTSELEIQEVSLTPRQKLIKTAIEVKLVDIDIDKNILLERVMKFNESLNSLNISQSKKNAYQEIIDVLILILEEKIMMNS